MRLPNQSSIQRFAFSQPAYVDGLGVAPQQFELVEGAFDWLVGLPVDALLAFIRKNCILDCNQYLINNIKVCGTISDPVLKNACFQPVWAAWSLCWNSCDLMYKATHTVLHPGHAPHL